MNLPRIAAIIVGALVGLCSQASAQEAATAAASATSPDCEAADVVTSALAQLAAQSAPPTTPALVENQASPAAGTTTAPVEGASRTNLLALAFDAGLVNREGGVTSISLAPLFDAIALHDPDVLDSQRRYNEYDWARRLGIKITTGGTGDAFDRDGDSVVDDALTSSSPSDIVTYEVSWQFGSRDRRDPVNFETLMARTARTEDAARLRDLQSLAAGIVLEQHRIRPELSCGQLAEAAVESAPFRKLAAGMRDPGAALAKAAEAAASAIDGKPIFRLVATGTQRKPQFGGDKRSFGVRFSKGRPNVSTGGWNLDVQLDYLRNELPYGADELEGWKLGTKLTATMLRGSPWFGGEGLLFSADGSVEKYSDVPAGQKDSTARLGLTWTFKVSDKAVVPLSITWANRTDLLENESDVIAHVGYSFDFGAFFEGMPR